MIFTNALYGKEKKVVYPTVYTKSRITIRESLHYITHCRNPIKIQLECKTQHRARTYSHSIQCYTTDGSRHVSWLKTNEIYVGLKLPYEIINNGAPKLIHTMAVSNLFKLLKNVNKLDKLRCVKKLLKVLVGVLMKKYCMSPTGSVILLT